MPYHCIICDVFTSSDPTPFVPFEFDSQMMDLTTTSVQAGQIVLNNLTVESLRDKYSCLVHLYC